MKIEDNCYILTQKFIGGDIYLTSDYSFSYDIRDALKAANKATALVVRDDYEDEIKKRGYLKIMPLKITYEYELEI